MSATPTPRILLVSRTSEAEEISRALVGAGFSAPAAAAGGDETLTVCEESEPDVVVLCASLEEGDARSLATAMRASAHGPRLRIVLVGDPAGPIRNALDAADFEVDRFVGRPLSAKALAFAVRSCAREVMSGRMEERADSPWPTPRPLAPPLHTSPARPPIVRSATTPGTGPGLPPAPVTIGGRRLTASDMPRLERAMDEAISHFVSDAMRALDTGWSIAAERDGEVQERVDDPPGGAIAAGEGSGPTPRTGAGTAAPRERAPEESDATPRERAPEESEAGGQSAWEEPPPAPAWREPTLILPGGGQSSPRSTGQSPAQASPSSIDIDVTAPQSASPWDEDGDPAEPGAPDPRRPRARREPLDAELRSGNGAAGDLEDEQELDGAARSRRGSDEVGASGEEGAKSPLARELRRKMSMMAERLFPGRGGDRQRLDVGLAHDAHTDIDLASIGLEAVGGGSAPYDAIGNVDTFADTNPLSRLEPTPPEPIAAEDNDDTTGRRRSITSEPPARGDLADIDVASLVGRLLQGRFTGRVQFRRGPAEKSISFEDGRPVFAISNLPHDRMGDLLYREGKITREQQQRARDLVVESGRRMGEILVEVGFLKPRELLPAVRHHIEDIFYSLFAWDAGEFAIASGEPTTERIRLTRHPAALVLEGVRRKYGPDQVEARLRSPAAVVAVRSQRQLGAIAAVADLSAGERAVIQKLDGERTIQQVAEAAQVDQLVAMQLAFALMALGVAEVVDLGPAMAERAPVRSRSLVGETDIAIDRQRVLAKHALVHEADYFTLLGVRRDATTFEIRRAYEAARRDYSATIFPPELQRELAGELGEINRLIDEAYQVLRDDRVRRSYQANLLD
ncbi:MAG TPA: DUF4388 domain-containing protein [Kofleriaceae bacterium]|nr:DUF4388 domain-containing protein [Kofleriaceae bacterium]